MYYVETRSREFQVKLDGAGTPPALLEAEKQWEIQFEAVKYVLFANHAETTGVTTQPAMVTPVPRASRHTMQVIMMSNDEFCRSLTELATALGNGPAVIATPEQVLTGHPVGPRADAAFCIGCGTPLHETDIAFAYAYRCAESAEWTVSRLYCHGCVPDSITSPTLGATEVLVGGRLGTITLPTVRRYRLCLTELALQSFSPATEGCPP